MLIYITSVQRSDQSSNRQSPDIVTGAYHDFPWPLLRRMRRKETEEMGSARPLTVGASSRATLHPEDPITTECPMIQFGSPQETGTEKPGKRAVVTSEQVLSCVLAARAWKVRLTRVVAMIYESIGKVRRDHQSEFQAWFFQRKIAQRPHRRSEKQLKGCFFVRDPANFLVRSDHPCINFPSIQIPRSRPRDSCCQDRLRLKAARRRRYVE